MCKSKLIFTVLTLAFTLGGCEQAKETLGLKRERPDEFQVLERRPLSVPPGYGLRPPLPGQKGEPELSPRKEAQTSLLGDDQQDLNETSSTETEILQKANADKKDAAIRNKLAGEVESNKPSIGEKMVFWKDRKPKGDVINPKEENVKYNGRELPGKPSQSAPPSTTEVTVESGE